MSYNQCQYRTRLLTSRIRTRREGPDDGSTVERPQALLHHPLDGHLVGSEESGDRTLSVRDRDAGQPDLPRAGLEPIGERARAGHHDLDDVQPVRKGEIQ